MITFPAWFIRAPTRYVELSALHFGGKRIERFVFQSVTMAHVKIKTGTLGALLWSGYYKSVGRVYEGDDLVAMTTTLLEITSPLKDSFG